MKYSNNFDFFLEHQIFIATTNNGRDIRFCSRLEPRLFGTIKTHWKDGLSDKQIIDECKKIHVSTEVHWEKRNQIK